MQYIIVHGKYEVKYRIYFIKCHGVVIFFKQLEGGGIYLGRCLFKKSLVSCNEFTHTFSFELRKAIYNLSVK